MANLFNPPPKFGIPLSRGGDIYLRFTLKVPDGNGGKVEVDFPPGSSLVFAITTAGQDSKLGDILGDDGLGGGVVGEEICTKATISGSQAEALVDHLRLDDLELGPDLGNTQLWRLTFTSAEGIDSPIANGWVFRADGEDDDGL